MSVFLRWGVFGMLTVAALVYAYNASKDLAGQHAAKNPPAANVQSDEAEADEATADEEAADRAERAPPAEPADIGPEMPEGCVEEARVAERALKMRRDGDTLDHLLRIDTIVFQSDEPRRDRLKAVATHWYEREGRDPDASALRSEVLRDCRKALAAGTVPATPAP